MPESGTNDPLEKRTLGKIGLRSTNSGGGEQFLAMDYIAKACMNYVFCSQAPVCRFMASWPVLKLTASSSN